MKMKVAVAIALALTVAANVHGGRNGLTPQIGYVRELLAQPILEKDDALASWSAAYNVVFDLDAAADDAWRAVRSKDEFDARRRALRAKMLDLLGGLPKERAPLNAKVVGHVPCGKCVVERIIFESLPGAYVTANLYLPDPSRHAAPFPAAIELCGHSSAGKNAPKYEHVAYLAAQSGLATLVVDPLCQGERAQCAEDLDGKCTHAHLRLGVNAMLLGHGLAAFEIWDAIRALDYLDSRTDLRHDGYGAFGNSGGGTQSVLLGAMDDRIRATATSCFLSSLREQNAWRLLADSEQLVFAQLREGINHAAYPLLAAGPVLMLARRDEMIPFSGTRETFRVLSAVSSNVGCRARFGFFDQPGPHGYNERSMRATVAFLAERLHVAVPDFKDVAELEKGTEDSRLVVSGGRVMNLPGFKSAYAYLEDELAAAESARPQFTAEARAALVRRLADIDERRLGERTVVSATALPDGMRVTRVIHEAAGGYRVPAVELVPATTKGNPVLVVGDSTRSDLAARVAALLGEGHAVLVADLVGVGEIGATRHHYVNPNDDEELAKMMYLTGSSLVGRRAGEILALARSLEASVGGKPQVVACGRIAVAAAHAYAAAPGTLSKVEVVNPPLSWAESVRKHALYDYANAIHGGLLHYDWPDLLTPVFSGSHFTRIVRRRAL